MAQILDDVMESRHATLVAERVHRLGDAAGPCSHDALWLQGMHPACVLDRQFEVQLELLLQVAVPPAVEERSD